MNRSIHFTGTFYDLLSSKIFGVQALASQNFKSEDFGYRKINFDMQSLALLLLVCRLYSYLLRDKVAINNESPSIWYSKSHFEHAIFRN